MACTPLEGDSTEWRILERRGTLIGGTLDPVSGVLWKANQKSRYRDTSVLDMCAGLHMHRAGRKIEDR